jgi:hypothetical protein
MPTRVLLEGPQIEPLLEQVRQEYGPGARIISAEKVRSGGVGGFFSRQRYELSIEVDDDTDAPAQQPLAEPVRARPATTHTKAGGSMPAESQPKVEAFTPLSLDDLLDLAEAREEHIGKATQSAHEAALAAAGAAGVPGAGGPAMGTPGTAPDPGTTSANGGLYRSGGFGPAGGTAGVPGAAGAGMSTTAGIPTTAGEPSGAGPAGMSPGAGTGSEPSALFDPRRAGRPTPLAGPTPTPEPDFADFMASLGMGHTTPPSPPKVPAPPPPPPPASAPTSSIPASTAPTSGPADIGAGTVPRGRPDARSVSEAANVRPYRPPTASRPAPQVAPQPPADLTNPIIEDLVAVGLPASIAATVTSSSPYEAVLEAFAGSTPPVRPPAEPGDILVIAGDLTPALAVARVAAAEMRLPTSSIMLVGPSTGGSGLKGAVRISGPTEAHRQARALKVADVPHIVVVEAPFDGPDDGWVKAICDALNATTVWAVVDATRKTTDTARHLSGMGRVDAIAVYSASITGDPASVLGLGLTVALVDGRPATAHTWATLLNERIRTGRGEGEGGRHVAH